MTYLCFIILPKVYLARNSFHSKINLKIGFWLWNSLVLLYHLEDASMREWLNYSTSWERTCWKYVPVFQDEVYTLSNHVICCSLAQAQINEPKNQRLVIAFAPNNLLTQVSFSIFTIFAAANLKVSCPWQVTTVVLPNQIRKPDKLKY